MITWRGWGFLVLIIGLVPFVFSVPFALETAEVDPGLPPPPITGYFVWPLLISALMTFGLHRYLQRTRSDRRHDFMSVSVGTWPFVFVGLAIVVFGIWLAELANLI